MNFFCEKHGKNQRDAHFSQLAKFINDASMQRALISTEDLVKAIENGQKLANQNRLLDGNRTKVPRSMRSLLIWFDLSNKIAVIFLRNGSCYHNRICARLPKFEQLHREITKDIYLSKNRQH